VKTWRGYSRAVSWRRANWWGRRSSWPPTRGFRTRGSPGRFRSAVDDRATIDWTFTTEKAREKLKKAYPVKES
jgi:hypothetical protein